LKYFPKKIPSEPRVKLFQRRVCHWSD